jgi:hypothetical protein
MKARGLQIGSAIAFVLLAIGTAAAQAPADSVQPLKLVNLETPSVLGPGQYDVTAEFRGFGGSDKLAYGTLEANGGFGNGLGLVLRSSFSRVAGFSTSGGTVEYGGTDYEAQLKYAIPSVSGLALMGGFSAPNTPAHHTLFGTASALYSYPLQPVNLYAGAKGVFGSNTSLVALCLGFDYKFQADFHLVGDGALVVTGDNTYSTSTGNAERSSLYGVAVRYSPSQAGLLRWSVDLGVTNALGGTSGFELTPSLGSTPGIYVAASVRF